ncbi:hypothetical protein M0P48_04740 [Candidatus Gracilibacteria bacterium]|jgi:hypothetical protein|nr:hypothetical protein [Candidatus Gracilibacteria bacterium]
MDMGKIAGACLVSALAVGGCKNTDGCDEVPAVDNLYAVTYDQARCMDKGEMEAYKAELARDRRDKANQMSGIEEEADLVPHEISHECGAKCRDALINYHGNR